VSNLRLILKWKGENYGAAREPVKADRGKGDQKAKSLCAKIDDHKADHEKIQIERMNRIRCKEKGIFRQKLFTSPGLC